MKWYSITLLKPEKSQDELGNRVDNGYVITLQTTARMTPWTAAQQAVSGVDMTKNPCRLAIPRASRKELADVTLALVDGCLCDVLEIRQASARWTHIVVAGWRDV